MFRINNPTEQLPSGADLIFKTGETHSVPFKTGPETGIMGQASMVETVRYSSDAEIAISETPGVFSDDKCRSAPYFETGIHFSIGELPSSLRARSYAYPCILKPNTQYYANIRFVDGVTKKASDWKCGSQYPACDMWFLMGH